MINWRAFAFLVAASSVLLVACSSPNAEPTPTPQAQGAQIQVLPATSDLAVGDTRVAFGLIGKGGDLIERADVSVVFCRITGTVCEGTQEEKALYRSLEIERQHLHSSGENHTHFEPLGVYVVDRVRLDTAGPWGMQATVSGTTGGPQTTAVTFQVKQRSATPPIGSPAPATGQKTARDVANLAEISSREPPVPALYQKTIAEAVTSGRPTVIVFSTPAYCQSRICGPVLDSVLKALPAYQDRVEFIHVEPYDLAKLRSGGTFELTEAAKEWGLPSEPWTFVVDATGRIAAKFEGIIAPEELEAALQPLVAPR